MTRRRTVGVPQVVVAASPPTELEPDDVPTSLGACADLLYELRAARLELEHKIEELRAREARVRDYLVGALEAQGLTAVVGGVARAGLTTMHVGRVKDWEAFAAHLFATRDLSLLQRRLNDGALRERWDVGETVPGVEAFLVPKVSLTKAR